MTASAQTPRHPGRGAAGSTQVGKTAKPQPAAESGSPSALQDLLAALRQIPLAGWIATIALTIFAMPTLMRLADTVWHTDEQGHGPFILALAVWLIWRTRHELLALANKPAGIFAWALLALALALYAIGRSQAVIQFETFGVLLALTTTIALMKGWRGVRLLLFPLFFLLFIIPWPGVMVQAMTVPLKIGVSYVAEWVLHHAGYPVARTGVILSVGQYQLLVADACAGLTSMFTLEVFGLLYLHLMGYTSKLRNVLLAILVIPCAFIANVVRVIILILVTFYFGDEAGQGFIHGFAGIVLFTVALILLIGVDSVIGKLFARQLGNDRKPSTAKAAA
jgi:exosortase B